MRNITATKLISVFIAALLSIACMGAIPQAAYAEIDNTSISTTAQMNTDNTLHVVEQRSYKFDKDYRILTWNFSGLKYDQEIKIQSARIIPVKDDGTSEGTGTPLKDASFQGGLRTLMERTGGIAKDVDKAVSEQDTSTQSPDNVTLPANDSYSYDQRDKVLYFFISTSSPVTIECEYVIEEATRIFTDVAELSWNYISLKDNVLANNVTLRIELPVPEGVVVVPGENVAAWGHGPQGTVDVKPGGTIVYQMPKVLPGQYAEAHVLFPQKWLTRAGQSKSVYYGTRFDEVVKSERTWKDSINANKVNGLIIQTVVLSLCFAALLASVILYSLFGKEREEEIRECKANPLKYSFAVLGRLLRWNHYDDVDFAYTLKQMADKGIITIEVPPEAEGTMSEVIARAESKVNAGSLDGKREPDVSAVRFRVTPQAKNATLNQLEKETMQIVFDVLGGGYQSVSIADIAAAAKKNPAEVKEKISQWQKTLSAEVDEAGLFDPKSYTVAKILWAVAVVFGVAALTDIIFSQDIVLFVAMLITMILVAIVAYNTPRHTPVGSALIRCLQAGEDAHASPQMPGFIADNPVWMRKLSDILYGAVENG